MRFRAATLIADAWEWWKADWTILTAVAGMFVFLPQFGGQLLIPALPDASAVTSRDPADPAFRAWTAALQSWIESYGGWQLAIFAMVAFGQFALLALYLGNARTSVGQSLIGALRLFARLLLASMIWSLPLGLASLVLIQLPWLLLPVGALVMARMLLVAPAILADRPIGAVAAVGRSFTLTRGHMMMLAGLLLGVMVAQMLVVAPLGMLDGWMEAHAPNPIARAIVDGAGAGAIMLGAIATALIEVAAWRRLSASSPRAAGS